MELEERIRQKRRELRDAFGAHQQARAALSGQAEPADSARLDEREAAERTAALRYQRISEELAELHRQKFGEWRCTWRGPIPGSR